MGHFPSSTWTHAPRREGLPLLRHRVLGSWPWGCCPPWGEAFSRYLAEGCSVSAGHRCGHGWMRNPYPGPISPRPACPSCPGLSGCHLLLLPPSSLATCPPPPLPTDPGSAVLPLSTSARATPILSSPLAANSAGIAWPQPGLVWLLHRLKPLSIGKNKKGSPKSSDSGLRPPKIWPYWAPRNSDSSDKQGHTLTLPHRLLGFRAPGLRTPASELHNSLAEGALILPGALECQSPRCPFGECEP